MIKILKYVFLVLKIHLNLQKIIGGGVLLAIYLITSQFEGGDDMMASVHHQFQEVIYKHIKLLTDTPLISFKEVRLLSLSLSLSVLKSMCVFG